LAIKSQIVTPLVSVGLKAALGQRLGAFLQSLPSKPFHVF